MLRRRTIIIFLKSRWTTLLALLYLCGCTNLPVTGNLPVGVQTVRLTAMSSNAPFAWHPSGASIAVGDNVLEVLDVNSGQRKELTKEIPAALCWSASGDRICAAFVHEGYSVVRLLDLLGRQLAETKVSGFATRMIWKAPDEILVMTVTLDKFAFGGNLKTMLYRWNGTTQPTMTILNDTTVRPYITKWPATVLYGTATFALSPLGDEIVFTRLHDPPLIQPSLEIVLRNLESGTERQVASASPASGGAVYSEDGELLLYGNGINATQWIDPWGEREFTAFASPGKTLTISPSGRYAFVDGHLYQDGKEVVSFPNTCTGMFSPSGDRLLISHDSHLYILSGLDGTHHAPPEVDNIEQLLTLRKWRSQGLISISEYRTAKERILKK